MLIGPICVIRASGKGQESRHDGDVEPADGTPVDLLQGIAQHEHDDGPQIEDCPAQGKLDPQEPEGQLGQHGAANKICGNHHQGGLQSLQHGLPGLPGLPEDGNHVQQENREDDQGDAQVEGDLRPIDVGRAGNDRGEGVRDEIGGPTPGAIAENQVARQIENKEQKARRDDKTATLEDSAKTLPERSLFQKKIAEQEN